MGELRILSEQTVKRCLGDDKIDACFEVCALRLIATTAGPARFSRSPARCILELPSDQPKKCRLKGAHFADIGVAGFRLASPGAYFTWVVDFANWPTGGVGRRELASPQTYGSYRCSDTPLVTSRSSGQLP